MNTEQERAEFEAWCVRKHPILITHRYVDNPDRYFSNYTQVAWEAYQAGRAALQSQEREGAEPMYYLQDTRTYVGNCPMWWALNGNGYTTRLDEAQRYTFDQAMRQHRSRNSDLPWLCSEIDKLQRPTVDVQHMHKIRTASAQSAALLDHARRIEGGEK